VDLNKMLTGKTILCEDRLSWFHLVFCVAFACSGDSEVNPGCKRLHRRGAVVAKAAQRRTEIKILLKISKTLLEVLVRKFFNFLILTLSVIVATGVTIRAQNALSPLGASRQVVAANSASTAPNAAMSQAVLSSLSSLPEADTLIYINPRRILNEVVPKLLPAKDAEGL
jgi:hypothetical protein